MSDDLREMLLAEARAASLRARFWQAQIDAIGTALKLGHIEPHLAIIRLRDLGVDLVMDAQPGDTIGGVP